MKKSAKKWILSGIGGVAAGAVLTEGLRYTARNLADIAMNRNLTAKAQKAMQATPRSVKDPALENRRLEAANRLRNSDCQIVKTDTFDGALLTGHLSDEYSCTQAMQKCKTPVLFVHGTDDTFVPIEMTYTNYKACSAPKRLLIVPGAEHCQSYLTEQGHYENELLKFWQDFD